jgi:putative ABC transport system permease protein
MTGRNRRDEDLQREIRQHLELEAEERVAEGASPEEARRAATRVFGSVTRAREDVRAVWIPMWMQQAAQDARYALRIARRSPAFTIGAILVFALGLGASTTIFGALKAVVLAPLPFENPSQLVRLEQTNLARGVDAFSVSLPLYRDWRERTRSFSAIGAERNGAVTVLGLGDPQHVEAVWMTHDLFALLGVAPALGRGFRQDDDLPGQGQVVILSHGFWRAAFGGDPQVLDRTLTIDGRTHTIVGVAPQNPLRTANHVLLPVVPFTEDRRGAANLDVYARLRPGVSMEQASSEMSAVAGQLAVEHAETQQGWGVRVTPLAQSVVGRQAPQLLYLMLAAVGVLLLVASANLSGLLLVRASARTREIAIRAAVGGGRERIIRQLLTESLLLAAAGGALGVALSYSGMRLLRAVLATEVARADQIGVDAWVMLFAFAISGATGILAGVMPARQMARLDVIRGLRGGSRSVTAGSDWSRSGLVVAQLALSVVLLTAAGLTIRTLNHLATVDLGFTPDRMLTVRVAPRDRPEQFVAALLERVRALPGVSSAGAASSAPMTPGNLSLNVFPVGEAQVAPTESVQAEWRIVSDGYFAAMETQILAGRDLSVRDDDNAPKAIVVNQTLARVMWGDRNPVGRQLDLGGGGGEPATVVGLVRDMRHHDPGVAAAPAYYVPAARGIWDGMTIVIRTAVAADALLPRIRAEVAALDPALPVFEVHTMDALVGAQLAPQRMAALVLTVFGGFAMLLAVIGIFGVMASVTRQRTRDAAIRLALGATRWAVIRPLAREGSLLVGIGVLAGLAVAIPLTRLMRNLLAGIGPNDPLSLGMAVSVLTVSALIACYLPVWRTSRVNPIEALRGD